MKYKKILFITINSLFISFSGGIAIGDSSSTVVISEIAWMGTKASSEDEWIELYNNTDAPVDLGGWVLKTADDSLNIKLEGIIPSKVFYLIERNNDGAVKDISADLIGNFGRGLSNQGETIQLYNSSNQIIDSIEAGGGWFQGKTSPSYQAMERIDLGKSGEAENWKTNDGLNVRGVDAQNNPIQGNPTNSQANLSPFPVSSPSIQPEHTITKNIFINEILPNPQGNDKEEEFIEIFNDNTEQTDLTDWYLEDASKSRYTISQKHFSSTIVDPKSYFIIYRKQSNLSLNNSSGDSVSLFSPRDELIDSLIYGDAAKDQHSFGLILDSIASGKKYEWSSTPTPGAANVINEIISLPAEKPETEEVKDIHNKTYSDQIIINEFLPDPVGADTENEWIELYNKGGAATDIGGWLLGNSKEDRFYSLPDSTVIAPLSFLILKRPDTKLPIKNTGDSITLYHPNKKIADKISFQEQAKEGQTFNRVNDNWRWSERSTPGELNIVVKTPKEDKVVKKPPAKKVKAKKIKAVPMPSSIPIDSSSVSSETKTALNSASPLSASASQPLNNSSAITLITVIAASFLGSIGGRTLSRKIS